MKFSVTPEEAISFTKLSVGLILSWPPSPVATKNEVLIFEVLWWVFLLSSMLLVLPLIMAAYEYREESIILGKTVCLLAAAIQITIKMVLCRIQRKRLQVLLFDMEEFCKNASDTHRLVLQRYVDGRKYVHVLYTFWCYFTTAVVVTAPFYSPQPFPTYAVYPFSVEDQPVRSIVYLHQSMVGFQASAGIVVDCQIALLLWYAAARFEILTMKLRDVTCERDLNDCISEHAEVLRYTKEVNRSVNFLVYTTITTSIVCVIFGSLILVTNQPIILKALYSVIVFNASIELFMCAWPADNVMNMSAATSFGAYNSNWSDQNVSLQKKILYLILRSQKPESIRISGILPVLNLPYYASYLYSSVSYFTAVRIMVGTNSN